MAKRAKNLSDGVGDEKGVANGTEIFGHFGWNGKRGIRLRFSKIFENFPVEWNVPFELLPENSGFSVQMVSGLRLVKATVTFPFSPWSK